MKSHRVAQDHADTCRRVQAQLEARGLGRHLAYAVTLRIPWKLLCLMEAQFSVTKVMLDTAAPEALLSTPSSPPPLT